MDIDTIDKFCLIEGSERMYIDEGYETGIEIHSEDEMEVEEVLTPMPGMVFSTHEDAYNFYNRYALNTGFGIRRSSTHKSNTDKSIVAGREFVCNKEGKKEPKNSERRELRTNCDAEMLIRLNDSGTWRVTRFVQGHNHEMSTPSKTSKHRSHQKIHRQIVVKNLMTQLHDEGVTNAGIVKVVNTLLPGGNLTGQHVHDHLRVERKNNLGKSCGMIVNHFMNKKAEDKEFFFKIEVTDDCILRSVFWADRRSQESYKKFSYVIIFDVTYRTNNFSLPFAPFTGINHHRQSSLFGCALLADETEDTFVWLFEQWLQCMGGGIKPAVIITDQDAAMGNAIKRVFPGTLHRYCDWHLDRNIAGNLQSMKATYDDDFELYFNKIRSSDSISETEQCWDELTTKYDLTGVRWLPNLWENKASWVPCYFKDKFVAGTRTSQRSESINSFFDKYVTSSTPLHEFVLQYDKALASRRRDEEDADFKTLNSKPVPTLSWVLEEEAGKCYTSTMFKMLHAQMKDGMTYWAEKTYKEGTITTFKVGRDEVEKSKWKTVTYDSNGVVVSCQCKHFESIGLLCRHAFCILWKKHIRKVPDRYVLKRWTIDCRFKSLDVGSKNDVVASQVAQVDCELICGIRYNIGKVLEKAYKSHTFALELDQCLKNLTKVDNEQISKVHGNVPLGSQYLCNNIPEIDIRDPSQAVRTKGRPKVISRIPSSLEKAQAEDTSK